MDWFQGVFYRHLNLSWNVPYCVEHYFQPHRKHQGFVRLVPCIWAGSNFKNVAHTTSYDKCHRHLRGCYHHHHHHSLKLIKPTYSSNSLPRHLCLWLPRLTDWLTPFSCSALPRTALCTNTGAFSKVPWMPPMSAERMEPEEILSIDRYKAGAGGTGMFC